MLKDIKNRRELITNLQTKTKLQPKQNTQSVKSFQMYTKDNTS